MKLKNFLIAGLVLLLTGCKNTPSGDGSPAAAVQEVTPGSMTRNEQREVNLVKAEGTITISQLYSDPAMYEGKTVRVQGEVTKFNAAIMERNWVHIQDGTEFEGKFDLTATSVESFETGVVVTLEGILAIDLDFGYGYSYEILLENATVVR